MAETLRSLTIKLGYDVDTTGADIFKSSFKRLKADLNRTKRNVKNKIRLKDIIKKPEKTPLNQYRNSFATLRNIVLRVRKNTKDKVRLSDLVKKPDDKVVNSYRSSFRKIKSFFTNLRSGIKKKIGIGEFIKTPRKDEFAKYTAGVNKRFNEAAKKIQSNAKRVLVGVGVAIAAATAASIKVFKGFSTIEQARGSLQARVGDERFDEILGKINAVRDETKGLVSELDVLNAFKIGADIIGDFDFLTGTLLDVIKNAKVLRISVEDVQQSFANFAAFGGNARELIKFGFFSVEELEALGKQQTGFTELGLRTRKAFLQEKIERRKPVVDVNFERFKTRSQATIDRLSVATEETVKIVGTKLNPAVNDIVKELTAVTLLFKNIVETGNLDKLIAPFTGGADKSRIDFTKPHSMTVGRDGKATYFQDSSVHNTTVNVSGSDPKAAAREVVAETAKRVSENSNLRKIVQSSNEIVIPSTSP